MEMHKEDHSNQQLSTEVETNNFGHPVLTEQNIVELLYQDKWNNIKDCKVASDKFVSKYHQIIEDNKETFEWKNASKTSFVWIFILVSAVFLSNLFSNPNFLKPFFI